MHILNHLSFSPFHEWGIFEHIQCACHFHMKSQILLYGVQINSSASVDIT